VFEDVAVAHGLSVGDQVPAEFRISGPGELTVAMIYGENAALNVEGSDWLMTMEGFEAAFPDLLDAQVYVRRADNVSTAEAFTAVERERPGTQALRYWTRMSTRPRR
jgi:hypothetical protein